MVLSYEPPSAVLFAAINVIAIFPLLFPVIAISVFAISS